MTDEELTRQLEQTRDDFNDKVSQARKAGLKVNLTFTGVTVQVECLRRIKPHKITTCPELGCDRVVGRDR